MRRICLHPAPPVRRAVVGLIATSVLAAAAACEPARSPPTAAEAGWFEDVALAAGLDFVHFNGMSGELYFCEIMGSGGALFDYDNDGDLDAYLVQGSMLGAGKTIEEATFPPRHPLPLTDRLYRNELRIGTGGSRELRFTDVTAEAGLGATTGYGMGVATGDWNNDGFVDLYVTQYGPDVMLRNEGEGTFRDVTAATGTSDARWSSSAAFFDYDADGWLDLYVANYVDHSLFNDKPCFSRSGRRDYCNPSAYGPTPATLYHNRGDETFEDVSGRSGVLAHYGPGLGVMPGDFDDDGRIDLFVANDGAPNFVWFNRGDGTFHEGALVAGAAVNMSGEAEAGMGVAVADFDRDGDEDVFLTHLTTETSTLYVNVGGGRFEDRTASSQLGPPSRPFTGFGTAFTDYDADGWLDLIAVNGGVTTLESLALAGDPFPLHQTSQLFRNQGDGTFSDVSAAAGPAFRASAVGRGAAVGDVDEDGDGDLLVTNNNGSAALLLNRVGQDRPWIGFRVRDERAHRDALDARVELIRLGVPVSVARVRTAGSYLSAGDPRVRFALSEGASVEQVRVRWPDGLHEEWARPASGGYVTLVRGSGRPVGS